MSHLGCKWDTLTDYGLNNNVSQTARDIHCFSQCTKQHGKGQLGVGKIDHPQQTTATGAVVEQDEEKCATIGAILADAAHHRT